MPLVPVSNIGQYGVNKDLSKHEMPINAWTDAQNIRFLDGYALQFYGHGEVYNSPSVTPQHVFPINVAGTRYFIYLSAAKSYAVTNTAGSAVHTDITHATPLTGTINAWTSTVLGGIPIINAGNTTNVPAYWDLNLANKFVNLTAWPANTYCKSLRAYKNFLVALNVTKAGVSYPYMVKWSSPADPGTLPTTWDPADTTKDAGESSLSEGTDPIVDGLQLRDSFIIYRESSIWRMDYVGGQFVFRFSKVLGTSGAMNRNCIVELDGFHVVLSGSDVIVHDGQTASSVLDKQTRRYLFQNIDTSAVDKCFVFKNPFLNEVFICYPSIGATSCDKAIVWNFKDKTVGFRDLPNINHAAFGPVDNTLANAWSGDSAPWDSDLTAWNGPEFTPDTTRVIMAPNTTKLYMLDANSSFDGVMPSAYLERVGLSFDSPESIKLARGIRARVTGNVGDTILISIGSSDDPYTTPTYTTMTHTIGSTIAVDCFVSGRYIAVKFSSGTAFQWRLDSYQIDIQNGGKW